MLLKIIFVEFSSFIEYNKIGRNLQYYSKKKEFPSLKISNLE